MNILALDLGTKTGWAIRKESPVNRHLVLGGTWKLSDAKSVTQARLEGWDRRYDSRFAALCLQIEGAIEAHGVKAVVFEDVLFSETTLQTQLWATFRAAIWAVRRRSWIDENETPFQIDCLNTGTLKKYATGHGNATKAMMSAHLLKKYPGGFVKNPKPTNNCFLLDSSGRKVDDNEVDARHLLDYFSSILA